MLWFRIRSVPTLQVGSGHGSVKLFPTVRWKTGKIWQFLKIGIFDLRYYKCSKVSQTILSKSTPWRSLYPQARSSAAGRSKVLVSGCDCRSLWRLSQSDSNSCNVANTRKRNCCRIRLAFRNVLDFVSGVRITFCFTFFVKICGTFIIYKIIMKTRRLWSGSQKSGIAPEKPCFSNFVQEKKWPFDLVACGVLFFHLFYWQIMCRFCISAVGCWLSDKAEVVKSAGLALRYTSFL